MSWLSDYHRSPRPDRPPELLRLWGDQDGVGLDLHPFVHHDCLVLGLPSSLVRDDPLHVDLYPAQ